MLRLDDLDGPRVSDRFVDAAQRDLEWLGLDWDGPRVLESEGAEAIHAAAAQLASAGVAYPCVCTRREIRASQSAPHQGEREPRYPGTCRGRFETIAEAEAAAGRDAGLRFRAPDGAVAFEDGVAGSVRADVAEEVGDFLIVRRDKQPAYQLAVVIDDARAGVTEVVRGDDLLPSTARQWLLQRALGYDHPAWFHVPLVVDATGRRLAKRHDDLSLTELRDAGADPRAVVAWAARSSGVPAPHRLTAAEAAPRFDWSKVPRTAVRLEPEDLDELRRAR